MKLACATTIGSVRLATYALVVVATAACGGGGGGDITPPTPTVTQVTLSPGSATVIAGQTTGFTAQPKDASGNPVNGLVVGWSINDPNVATVSNGTVAGVRPGQAIVTATVGNVSTTANVTVVPAVANVTVAAPANPLLIGQTATLTATLTDAGGATITGRPVTWTSNNDAVASVSSGGVVTAKANGSATITASVEGKSGTATVEVRTAIVTSVAVSGGTIRVGGHVQLRATGTLTDGTSQPLTGSAVAWSSSDQSKATVDADGNVTGVAIGSATITATNPSSGKAGSGTVTVVSAQSPIITALAVAPASVDVRGAAQTVTVSGTVSDGSGTGIKSVEVTASGHTLSTAHADPTASCTASGSGIGANGAWSCTFTLPRGAAAGLWPIVSAVVTDNAGHVTTYGAGDVAGAFNAKVTVTSDEDMTAPQLTEITVDPTSVNVSSSSQNIVMRAHYLDNLSGVARVNYRVTSVATPSTFVECTATLQSGGAADGWWGCTVTIPQGAPAGNWTQTFTAFDAALNKLMNTPAALIQVTR